MNAYQTTIAAIARGAGDAKAIARKTGQSLPTVRAMIQTALFSGHIAKQGDRLVACFAQPSAQR